ncbi:hypothetical protein [Pontibacillus litoralis]|uniref:Cytosolic protein n=1 Tax=Pontibacillus litoralis JSM 072002 TaxID=1385512 RepID=A0A0A5GA97_9BACI|nr:hypothetical protein [Pontibacillus litoralis]KGX88118.1 hypothetical protein N784_10250 [Pontibacillus litoralis JSM 072002]
MYVGRDMTELSMIAKCDWNEDELAYFQHALSQILPYLNKEGVATLHEIIEEMDQRGGLYHKEATWSSGTKPTYD